MRPIPESSAPAGFKRAVREHPLPAFLVILDPVSR